MRAAGIIASRMLGWAAAVTLYTILWTIGFALIVGLPLLLLDRLVNHW